ncbi:MAG: phosphomannomutase [Candidatus Moranbacteria bacterium]|nr:phosphomannomutase [Candidatus Moranbacteria bacterium]
MTEKKIEINPYIFRGYDIRGVAGKDLNYDVVKQIAKGYAYYLEQRRIKDAVVGYDCRLTGEEYKKAVIDGLIESGINVVDLGMCLTQMVYFAQYHYKTNGGIMITASHNPADYNGMKLALGYSNTLGTEEIIELREMVWQGKEVKTDRPGQVLKARNFQEAYIYDVVKRISLKSFKPLILVDPSDSYPKAEVINLDKKFKVVIDASNGTTGAIAPDLLRQIGIEVIEQNCEIDGNFPNGTPDPTEEHILKRLGERVVKEKADLGISFDGDGDRMGVVDEKGNPIWADILVAIFADDILDYLPGGKIVYNALCSKVVEEVVSQKGIPIMHKTGHTFIKEKVSQEKAVFGGELSGHFFFVDNFYGHDDAIFSALRLLEYLERKAKPLSKIIDGFPKYISSPEIKLGCPDELKFDLVDNKLVKEFKEKYAGAEFSTIDGIRVDFPDGMLIVRYSQNGPYITIKFESKTQKVYDRLREEIKTVLKKYSEINWDEGVNLESF